MQWIAEDRAAEVHVHPLDDVIEHDLDGTKCPCGVTVEQTRGVPLVTHHSLDGRELIYG